MLLQLSFALLYNLASVLLFRTQAITASWRKKALFTDILILIGLGISLAFAVLGSLFVLWRAPDFSGSGKILCKDDNLFTEQCQPIFYSLGRVQLVAIGLGAVVL